MLLNGKTLWELPSPLEFVIVVSSPVYQTHVTMLGCGDISIDGTNT